MSEVAVAISLRSRAITAASAYVALTKPRVVAMVLVTTVAGLYLGSNGVLDPALTLVLLAATALAASGTLALNQYLERDLDARMERTKMRPLPLQQLTPNQALGFGLLLTIAGCAILWMAINPLTSEITAAISVIYLFGYTPMKRHSAFCSVVGAVPGALPPVAGWAAARNAIGIEPVVLFAIMFLWQLPHSLAIAQLYRDDYARAGIRLLPTADPNGNSTGRQVVSNSLALMAVAMLPTVLRFAGITYFIVAAALGVILLTASVRLAAAPGERPAARKLMFASIVYLPVLLLVMMLDRI